MLIYAVSFIKCKKGRIGEAQLSDDILGPRIFTLHYSSPYEFEIYLAIEVTELSPFEIAVTKRARAKEENSWQQ